MEYLYIVVGITSLLIVVRHVYGRGRMAGLTEATAELTDGLVAVCEQDGQAVPASVQSAIKKLNRTGGAGHDSAAAAYAAELRGYGEVLGRACWQAGLAKGLEQARVDKSTR